MRGLPENDNKRPNLRGDVLELAETLRDGVGAVLLLGDGAAQGHGLPHEELGTLAHSHHSRGLHCHHSRWLHGHHASWLHGQGTGGFEHGWGVAVFAIGVGSGELASSLEIERA